MVFFGVSLNNILGVLEPWNHLRVLYGDFGKKGWFQIFRLEPPRFQIRVVWNHPGPFRMHYNSFHRKTIFDFFSTFFKHFSKDFFLFLKDLSCTSRKNSIFFQK